MTQLKEYLNSKNQTFPLKLNIQYFADDDTDKGEPDNKDKGEPDDKDKGEPDDKTIPPKADDFTPEQQKKVDDIVKSRVADVEKQKAEAVKEAEKLAKMNAQQRQEHELTKANEEIATLKREQNLHNMSVEASKMLSEKNISASPELLAQVTKETAEDTQTAVTEFINVVDSEVQKQVADKLRGNTPVGSNNSSTTGYKSLDEIAKISDASERLALIRQHHV